MKLLQDRIRSALVQALSAQCDIAPADIQLSVPPERKFGDLSTPLAFTLAKRTKEKPLPVAEKIRAALAGKIEFVADIRLAGGGFLNFFLDRDLFCRYLSERAGCPGEAKNEKIVIEHTSINPNKSAHIGHLRNACLGDTLVRAHRFLGYAVEVQNYIDDTGIQIADVVWGLLYHQKKTLAEIRAIDQLAAYLWEIYAEAHRLFESDKTRQNERNEVHRKIEHKIDPEYSVAHYVSRQVALDHIRLMEQLDIRYDLLVRESDIITLDFFRTAAAELSERGILYDSKDPEKLGCRVIRYRRDDSEKIVVRSNGTVTYIGKDIAYQMWKFGLLPSDFYYEPFYAYPAGGNLFMTRGDPGQSVPGYAQAERVFNVIDVRQSYLQEIIGQVLAELGHQRQSENYVHFDYEMVALTPGCVKEIGFLMSASDEKKAYVEVSGRKGIAVKADDLLAKLVEKSAAEIRLRNPELEAERIQALARDIACGALRYFMIKFHANSVIAFDFKEALNFEGDSGPYLQYTMVRIGSILKKLEKRADVIWPADWSLRELAAEEQELYWELLLHLSLPEIQVELALKNREISTIAAYVFLLCQKMNHYYHLFPVIAAGAPNRQQVRLNLILIFQRQLEKLLQIMGIPVPEKM